MPTKYKDYPIYTYNEPATYNDFTGGINTDPSNEHLLKNEMRDCVNMTYLSGALVKRKGAKEICKITCDEDIKNIQGVFLFTYKITYIIVAADGKLYQAAFNENTTIKLNRLNIYKLSSSSNKMFDETNVFEGLETYQKTDVVPDKHEGFILDYIRNDLTKAELLLNKRTKWSEVLSGYIDRGDYFEETEGLYKVKYVCITPFEKTIILPTNVEYWEEYNKEEGDTPQEWSINKYIRWTVNDIISYKPNDSTPVSYYKCIKTHTNRYNSLNDDSLFIKSSAYSTNYSFFSTLTFQNYRKIEAATFDNKLYVMTGTRIVIVEIQNNKLVANILEPHICNLSEITNIGYNYISPYPELAVGTQTNTVTTSIGSIAVRKTIYGKYILESIFNVQIGDDINNYWFRWEKYINNTWYTIVPFRIQDANYQSSLGLSSSSNYSSIEVDDADTVKYRVTFARSFETPNIIVGDWDLSIKDTFEKGDLIKYKDIIYACVTPHNSTAYPSGTFTTNGSVSNVAQQLWEPYLEYEMVNFITNATLDTSNLIINNFTMSKKYNKNDLIKVDGKLYVCQIEHTTDTTLYTNSEFNPNVKDSNDNLYWQPLHSYTTIADYKIDRIDGEYFGQATSVLHKDLTISDDFNIIHSCTKILVDGNKLLYYGDNYNTGKWFKTILNNPGYVTDRGCLSFKTTKNESLIKALAFQGNIICFANSENVGGSIHIVTGNGDDYDGGDGYYSPYQRRTINSTVSSDNEDTIQVCDNILIFKYFKKLYYINASDLSNEVIKVNQCNTRVLNKNNEVDIPWDDNTCISEVTNDYYALIWREKFSIDNNNKLVQERPGIRLKMYYNMANQLEDGSYSMPWLRDESKYFNISFIIYYKGKSLVLYNNLLLSFNEDTYEDIDDTVTCTIKLKGEDLNYSKIFKLVSSILVYYHRNQHSKIDFNIITRNEAGHIIYNSKNKLFSISDLRNFREGDKVSDEVIRLDSTIQDTKLFNVINKFPCLLAETTITSESKGRFSLSSITYNYETIDTPESDPYNMYTNIIRPEEV